MHKAGGGAETGDSLPARFCVVCKLRLVVTFLKMVETKQE